MAIRYPFILLSKTFRNLYFLMFLNGFLLASIFYFRMQASYEDDLFASLKASIDRSLDRDDTSDTVVVKAMKACHNLMSNRALTFNGNNPLNAETDLFQSATEDLMTNRGACGSYALVLARLLDEYDYPVRIAQMKAGGAYGAHNVVEVNTGRSWIVLDPTYNVCFIRPDARLASFADVRKNWNYYALQTPADYNRSYRYEDVRYTNWEKIPVVLPAIKSLCIWIFGANPTETFSLRTRLLKIYTVYFYLLLIIYIPILLHTFRRSLQVHTPRAKVFDLRPSHLFDVGLSHKTK